MKMKQFRKITKLVLVAVLLCATLLLTASCAQKAPEAEDASGTVDSLTWSYQKATNTLTVNGTGAIKNFESTDAVSWKAVRASVKKLVVGEGITEIGDYAFYYMPSLVEVSLPSTLTRIGKCSFAFGASLAALTVPASVTAVGESAFEGCKALTSISMDGCASIGARAFAFCRSLEKVYLFGNPDAIGKWTFKDCAKLSRLVLLAGTENIAIDPAAFEGAAMGADKIERQVSKILTVTFRYEDEDGKEMSWEGNTAPEVEKRGELDSVYVVSVPKRDGYTAVLKGSHTEVLSITGTFGKGADSYTVVYKLNAPAPETQPPADGGDQNTQQPPEEPEKLTAGSIIAIVIMVAVLAGIGVGAFLLMRSDKKGNSQTVRKNDKNHTKKK